jgi:L-fucose isomerase-like protein
MCEKFSYHHMEILLGDFNAKLGIEDIFKPIAWKAVLHEINNDNVVRLVNLATS